MAPTSDDIYQVFRKSPLRLSFLECNFKIESILNTFFTIQYNIDKKYFDRFINLIIKLLYIYYGIK